MGRALLAACVFTAMAAGRPDGATARFPKGLQPMELGPPAKGLRDWSQANCAHCHRREAEAWALSAHATARTNLVFQAALTRDDPAWCIRCHAPLAKDLGAGPIRADAPAEERGVTCAACHAGHGAVVAPEDAAAPHALEISPHAGGAALCAQCHQFGFAVHASDGTMVALAGAPLQQNTYGEWNAWHAASGDARDCLACHGGDHAFGGRHPTDRLSQAISVRVAPGALELSTHDVGHALPTGDVMRWLTVEAASDPLFEDPVELARFGRELGLTPPPQRQRTVVADHRLQPGAPERVAVPPIDAKGRPLKAWRLVYHLVNLDQEREGMLDPETSRVILKSGYLDSSGGDK